MAAELRTERGAYRLLRRVTSGSLSELYEADRLEADGTRVRVAIKRVRSGDYADRAETRLIDPLRPSSLGWIHPNIVRVLDRGESAGGQFSVLEWIDGYDLAAATEKANRCGEAVPLAVALYVSIHILEALSFVYLGASPPEGSFVPDLLPRRVMLTRRGVVKVIGPSRRRVPRPDAPPDQVAVWSPEEIRTGRGDERSVLFTVAGLFFGLVLGRPLFGGPTSDDVRRAVLDGTIPSLRRLSSEASFELDAAMRRALAQSPDDRFPSVIDFRRSVEDSMFQAGLEVDAGYVSDWIGSLEGDPGSASRPPHSPSQRPSSRHVQGREGVIQDIPLSAPVPAEAEWVSDSAGRAPEPEVEERTVLMKSEALARLVRDSVAPAVSATPAIRSSGGRPSDPSLEATRVDLQPPLDAVLEEETTRPGRRTKVGEDGEGGNQAGDPN